MAKSHSPLGGREFRMTTAAKSVIGTALSSSARADTAAATPSDRTLRAASGTAGLACLIAGSAIIGNADPVRTDSGATIRLFAYPSADEASPTCASRSWRRDGLAARQVAALRCADALDQKSLPRAYPLHPTARGRALRGLGAIHLLHR